MDSLALAAAAFAIAATLLHVLTVLIAAARFNRPSAVAARPECDLPPVTLIRPLCGIDAYEDETLRSVFRLDHPDYEIILCVADPGDPVIPLARAAIAAHPEVAARLLIGDDRISPNPKLNNVVKGWRAARHDWIVIVDSNVLVPRDYLGRLLATWRDDTGLVCAPPIGALPDGFAAEIECAFLNTYQARWQYAVDTFGFGFAQGKTMLWRRGDLDAAGGLVALAREVAEDAAATKVVRAQRRRVRLVNQPFPQLLGNRTLANVWNRQLRWARLRRASFPVFWLGAEARLAAAAGWHLSWRSPFAWLARDLMLPVLWCAALTGSTFEWRGSAMRATATANR